jgi:RNA polymerase sigma factor (TIGR02999 family)
VSEDPAQSEISVLLKRCAAGDRDAEDRVYEIAYLDLKRIARLLFRSETQKITLQPSVLVNEAFLRMPKAGEIAWEGREHFFAIASRAMRRVLVDHARARKAEKRPDPSKKQELTISSSIDLRDPDQVLIIDEALTRFSEIDPRAAQIIEMRYFAEMTIEEIANVIGRDIRTVKRDWADGRLWLFSHLRGGRE